MTHSLRIVAKQAQPHYNAVKFAAVARNLGSEGTGRARFGSTRNPIWRGGGVVFGPRGNENYKLKLSKTSKLVALRQTLTLANQAKIIVSDIKTTGKTAEICEIFADNKFDYKDTKVLIVVDEKNT